MPKVKKSRIKTWNIALLAFLFITLSCEHKDLDFPQDHYAELEIKFDWSKAGKDATPRTMVVQIFRADGSHYQRREFISPQGGKIRIEAGEYKLLFHNGEMASIVERGTHYGNYELATISQSLLAPMGLSELSIPPVPEDAEDQPVRNMPDNIWGGKHDYLQVKEKAKGQSVTLRPQKATIEYKVEICNVKNLDEMMDISAAISGMSESWLPAKGESAGVPVTIPFEVQRDADKNRLTAYFIAFGHCPGGQEGKHTLTIYTSRKKYYPYDVTDQLHKGHDDPAHIRIVIENGPELPTEEGGMGPSISDWDNVEEKDINMN